MQPSTSPSIRLKITIALLLIITSFITIFNSHYLIAAIHPDSLNGVETRFKINAELLSSNVNLNKPILITALFSTCASTCPANVNLLRKFKRAYPAEAAFLFIALQPDRDSKAALEKYLQAFNPQLHIYLPADKQALQQVMTALPETYADSKASHHAGYIYLYHPNARGLVSYRSPTYQHLIEDLQALQARGIQI